MLVGGYNSISAASASSILVFEPVQYLVEPIESAYRTFKVVIIAFKTHE